jgi:dolichyl-phosphate beta-glucosyltransferase
MIKLSVIIPAYDEAGRIGPTLSRIHEYLAGTGLDHEIIVVDDGSQDQTREVVRRAASDIPTLRIIENGVNRGKGYSVKRGFLESSGELALFSDADLSTPIEELGRFLPEMEKGADAVIGSRALRDSDIIKRQPLHRMLMGKTFNKIVRILAVRGIVDTQCGFKLFRRAAFRPIFKAQRVERFAFDVELLFLADKKGLNVKELPVRWINSPLSKVHILRDSSRMLMDVIGIRLRYLAGGYNGL